jgi:hypothetical protein
MDECDALLQNSMTSDARLFCFIHSFCYWSLIGDVLSTGHTNETVQRIFNHFYPEMYRLSWHVGDSIGQKQVILASTINNGCVAEMKKFTRVRVHCIYPLNAASYHSFRQFVESL